MKELKCPKCGNAFVVDEADYASIVNQVKILYPFNACLSGLGDTSVLPCGSLFSSVVGMV